MIWLIIAVVYLLVGWLFLDALKEQIHDAANRELGKFSPTERGIGIALGLFVMLVAWPVFIYKEQR